MRVVVTGANRGLGLGFVRAYLAAGERVLGLCRAPAAAEALAELARGSDGALELRAADVRDAESLRVAAVDIDRVDVLVNNAGIIGQAEEHLIELDIEVAARVMDVNVFGALRSTRAFLPALERSNGGKIVNLSSLMGSTGDNQSGGYSGYRMSKAALNMLTRNLGHALDPRRLVVAALHPGWVRTDMGGARAPCEVEVAVAAMVKTIAALEAEHSGGFFDRFGEILPV